MGLEGTLRVFSLSEIFQVLGLQRKSGVLLVESEEDTITISFLGGQVVSAESRAHGLENQVGALLIRAGRIDETQLARVLELQKESQQRLGFLLIRERLVQPEELREALRLQIFRTVYRAFRWTDGRFRFSQDLPIEYDADHMSPVSTEAVLLEAAQMLDEWPMLQKRIPSKEVVFRRAPGVEDLTLVGPGEEGEGEGSLAVSKNEAETWRWVDGRRRVSEILERAFLSDFEVLKGLSELVDRNIIVEGKLEDEPLPSTPVPHRRSLSTAILWGAFGAVLLLGAYLFPRNPWNVPLRPATGARPLATLFKAVSLDRLFRLERAVRVYYDGTGRYPRSLEDLVTRGILHEDAVRDPYGRLYRYILRSDDGKFGLYGRNAAGEIDLDLSLDRTLAPVAGLRPAPSRARQPEARRGVQVIN